MGNSMFESWNLKIYLICRLSVLIYDFKAQRSVFGLREVEILLDVVSSQTSVLCLVTKRPLIYITLTKFSLFKKENTIMIISAYLRFGGLFYILGFSSIFLHFGFPLYIARSHREFYFYIKKPQYVLQGSL